MRFINDIKNLFRTPTANQIAERELKETERLLLKHRDSAEYSNAMVGYLEQKEARLRDHLANCEHESTAYFTHEAMHDIFAGMRKDAVPASR